MKQLPFFADELETVIHSEYRMYMLRFIHKNEDGEQVSVNIVVPLDVIDDWLKDYSKHREQDAEERN